MADAVGMRSIRLADILPSVDYLRERFDLDAKNGLLIWRSRPIHHFYDKKGRYSASGLQKSWNSKYAGKIAGRINTINDYARVKLDNISYSIHRIIWALYYGYWPTNEIDHRYGREAGNNIFNLREASHSQNLCNRESWNKLSKGIRRHGSGFQARVCLDGKIYSIGVFKTLEEAAEARAVAAKKLHGEFFHV